MGSIEGVGVQKKLERPTGCAFGRILGMIGGISPILFPSRLGGAVRAGLGVCWGFLLHFGFLWASGVVGFLGFFL
jgi:hypothetical protein